MLKIKSKVEEIIKLANEISKETEYLVEQNDLYSCLIKMIKWTHRVQETHVKKKLFTPKSWAKENATIKFAVPRQSGHTTMAMKLFNNLEQSILLLPTKDMVSNVRKNFNIIGQSGFGTAFDVERGKFSGIYLEMVIVDCASLFSQKEIETIYDEFSTRAYNQSNFIFLFLE